MSGSGSATGQRSSRATEYRGIVTDRWIDRVPDAPGGVPGAWFNALLGGGLVVGSPTIAFTTGEPPASVLFAIAALGLFGFLEVVFVYKLYQRIAGRRALRAERDDDRESDPGHSSKALTRP